MMSLTKNWWLVVLRGVLAVLFGLTAFLWPGLTMLVLIILFGVYALADGVVAVITGVFEIVGAIRLRREIDNEWLLMLGGLLSIAFGVLLVLYPAAAGLALIWMIGSFEIVFGILLIALGFRLKSHGLESDRPMTPLPRPR